ncbi:hypothetical protein ACH347_13540 [Saccharopolyspora sp. 5N102]|uniref:hypothetical protein n=1 Tax=Saccharopolyspora sp. 5N102 TaxID=3375155 RepID=UPI0037A0EF0B
MSINNAEAALGEAARAYLKARRWLWIGMAAALLAGAAWFAVTIGGLFAQLAPETIQFWQQACFCVALPALIATSSAGGSRQTAEAWLRSLQHRLAPGSYSSSTLADARKLAHRS